VSRIPCHVSLLVSSLVLACTFLFAPDAYARPWDNEEPSTSEWSIDRQDALDTAPNAFREVGQTPRAPLWIAIQVGIVRSVAGERSWSGMVLAGIPLERLGDRRLPLARALIAEGDAPHLKPPPDRSNASRVTPSTDAPPAPAPAPAPEAHGASDVPSSARTARITPETARAAVRAALRYAHLADPEARVESIASRARTAALLPELRLRASRLIDESENLTPTEYDPTHRTASGGTSLWLEARATWRLDRLVFADEEVPLERVLRDRAEAQAKLATHVLSLLFAWQRSLGRAADPDRAPEERGTATLEAIEAEVTLDVVTNGWFTRWRKSYR
jgi:hypothetical protein